jgi:hypothetical protein
MNKFLNLLVFAIVLVSSVVADDTSVNNPFGVTGVKTNIGTQIAPR